MLFRSIGANKSPSTLGTVDDESKGLPFIAGTRWQRLLALAIWVATRNLPSLMIYGIGGFFFTIFYGYQKASEQADRTSIAAKLTVNKLKVIKGGTTC